MLSLLPFLAPILLQHRVATVEAVVRELAEKTGRPLAIRSEVRDEVVDVALGPHSADDRMTEPSRAEPRRSRVDYDARIDLGEVTIGFKRTGAGKIAAFWHESGSAPDGMGEYGEEDFAAPTSRNVILPNGKRTPEGGRAWIHGDRVAVIDREDWNALLARLGLRPAQRRAQALLRTPSAASGS